MENGGVWGHGISQDFEIGLVYISSRFENVLVIALLENQWPRHCECIKPADWLVQNGQKYGKLKYLILQNQFVHFLFTPL